MKNLILILSLCFVLFSCFEKKGEVVPEEPPMEENIMECEQVIKFIEEMRTYPVAENQEDRSTIKKYTFDDRIVYMLNPGSYFIDAFPIIIDSNCNEVCRYSQLLEEDTCSDLEVEVVTFIEVIWRHDE